MVREVEETVLPGVGIQFAFKTASGQRLSVIARRNGRHQVCLSHPDDPDASQTLLDLEESEARQLAELLGGSQVLRDLERVQQLGQEVTLEWVPAGSQVTGRSIGDLHVRAQTGATIVALIRNGRPLANPGPDTTFEAGDQVAILGEPAGVEQATELLAG
jgi:TrkA domain protein